MKTNRNIQLLILGLTMVLTIGFGSCNDEYIVGGSIHDPNVNETTYDFLKNHPMHFFDTTLLIIDRAGMKDIINGNVTFFVPNDFAINTFLNYKRQEVRDIDERLDYTLDTLFKYSSQQDLRDMMGMYIIPKKLNREDMTAEGAYYDTYTPGVKMFISLEDVNEYLVDGIITTKPKYVFFTQVLGEKDIDGKDPSGDDDLNDIKIKVQTSGIISTTGIVHVLSNIHSWTFFTYVP